MAGEKVKAQKFKSTLLSSLSTDGEQGNDLQDMAELLAGIERSTSDDATLTPPELDDRDLSPPATPSGVFINEDEITEDKLNEDPPETVNDTRDFAPPKASIKAKPGGLKSIAKETDDPVSDEEHYEKFQAKVKMGAEKARRIMNLLATMGPVFKRVVGNSDSDDAARLVSDLLVKAESLKQNLYGIFNAEHEGEVPPWLKAQLSRYSATMATDNPDMSIQDMVAISQTLSEFMPDLRYEYSNKSDDKTQIKLSLIKSISKIEAEINEFYYRLKETGDQVLVDRIKSNREEILSEVSGFIVDKVSDALNSIVEPSSTQRTRTMMAQSLINHASEFYLSALSYEISLFWERRSINDKKGKGQQFVEKFTGRHPTGLPLEATHKEAMLSFDALLSSTQKEFDKQFDRLINFTNVKITDTINKI